jgi:hypothetical protein
MQSFETKRLSQQLSRGCSRHHLASFSFFVSLLLSLICKGDPYLEKCAQRTLGVGDFFFVVACTQGRRPVSFVIAHIPLRGGGRKTRIKQTNKQQLSRSYNDESPNEIFNMPHAHQYEEKEKKKSTALLSIRVSSSYSPLSMTLSTPDSRESSEAGAPNRGLQAVLTHYPVVVPCVFPHCHYPWIAAVGKDMAAGHPVA